MGYGIGAAALMIAQKQLGTNYKRIPDLYSDLVVRVTGSLEAKSRLVDKHLFFEPTFLTMARQAGFQRSTILRSRRASSIASRSVQNCWRRVAFAIRRLPRQPRRFTVSSSTSTTLTRTRIRCRHLTRSFCERSDFFQRRFCRALKLV